MSKRETLKWVGNTSKFPEFIGHGDSAQLSGTGELTITNSTGAVCICPMNSLVVKTSGAFSNSYHFELNG